MITGTIFSIEEFAINDGPGIRTTVFLKGCPLRCAWCHNPEGLSFAPQVMHKKDRDEISGEIISSDSLASRLLKNREFFAMNEGGVTFTGGEPTAQPAFLIDILGKLPGIHRAIETSGFCQSEVFARILENLDYVLFDIKLVDPAEHKRWTGVDNAPILANLELLKASGKPFVIRVPLIPGVNDSIDNMKATRDLVAGAPGLQRVELLRYHKTAGAKYSMVDMEYTPGFDTEAVPHIHNVFSSANINLIIL